MSLGASRLKKSVLVPGVVLLVGSSFLGCGGGATQSNKIPPSGLNTRVLASQSVTAGTAFGGLPIIDAFNDTLPRVAPIGAGSLITPGLMAISANRATVIVFDSGSNQIDVINTTTEAVSGSIAIPGFTSSIVIPAQSASVAFAAVPTASVGGIFSPAGGISFLNLATNSTNSTIGVPGAQTVVSNAGGTQLLAFSADIDSFAVVSPSVAVAPADQGCDPGSPSLACFLVSGPGFSRPVYAIYSSDGSTAYVLNCGLQCGGTQQASVAVVDTSTFAVKNSIPVDGATWALLSGTTLYVAGTPGTPGIPATANQCTGPTAAKICGRLDIIDLSSGAVTGAVEIVDGYHDRMDMSANGQLFIGSYKCTTIGNVNDPVGEVRGCLAIYNTGEGNVVIPPDNGDVTGLQGLTNRYIEYVAEGGNLRVYNTDLDILLLNADFIPNGTIPIVGVVIDVKEIDFF